MKALFLVIPICVRGMVVKFGCINSSNCDVLPIYVQSLNNGPINLHEYVLNT